MDPLLADVMAVAARNHGLVSADEFAARGISMRKVVLLVEAGIFVRLAREVYRVNGAPVTGDQRILAATMASAGSVASHRSAGHLLGLPGLRDPAPEVSLLHARNRRTPLGRVHGTLLLPPDHVTSVRGIPTTTAARTVFDLAGTEHPSRAERFLDAALKRQLCTVRDVSLVFFVLARRGRRGTAAMRRFLEERDATYVAPASELERVGRRLFSDAGLPPPAFEVWLGDREDRIGRVDCVWRRERVVVELDGGRFHDDPASRAADRQRDNRLMAEGWRVLRFTWHDLTQRGAQVVALVRRALEGR